MDTLLSVWTFKFSLIPVLATYTLFEVPTLIRRLTRRLYVPAYFIFFPLGYTDELYSQYFGDSDFYGVEDLTPKQRKALGKRISAISVLSVVIGAVLTPALVGFLTAIYLTASDFWQFLGFLVIVKGALLVKSWIDLKWHIPFYDRGKRVWIAVLYVLYLVFVAFGLWWANDLATRYLPQFGFWGTLVELARYAYVQYFLAILCVAAVTWAVTNANLKE